MSMRGLYGSVENVRCEKVSFEVSGPFGKQTIGHAIIIPKLDLPRQTLPLDLSHSIERQEKIKLPAFRDAQVCMLIGQDNWSLIVCDETRRLGRGGLAISHSALGWTVHGYVEEGKGFDISLHTFAVGTTEIEEEDAQRRQLERLDKVVGDYLELENLGVIAPARKNAKDERALAILEATSRKTTDGWETGLLWKPGLMPKVDSKATALKRLYSVEKKLDENQDFARKYYREMERLIENGYAVKVKKDLQRPRIWYVPHFGVENINKPDKVRLVFDAAAKTRGVSLNDLLETGPDLLESLIGVLLRFRQYPVAVKDDIKDMFLRVSLVERDRGAQRFLWRGADRNREPDIYENTSLIFGSKSSPCSAIYIKNTNAERFKDSKPETVRSIIKNSYMDDYLASGNSIEEMRKRVLEVIEINKEANLYLHGWASNEPRVVEDVRDANKLPKNDQASFGDQEERVLGLYWDRNADELRFNVGLHKIHPNVTQGRVKPTKREFFSIVMSVYDPLGIIAPFTVQAKMLMQKIWLSGVGWDAAIRDEEFTAWQAWLRNLVKMQECKIPRCYLGKSAQYVTSQLHIFSDASLKAYAAVAYLRSETQDGVRLSLVMSKSRVAQTKPSTVPRLELQAALLAARMATTIGKELELNIEKRVFWSDSAVVLHWIRGDARDRQMFVANRLAEINELTSKEEWRWVPTKVNPADDATRNSKKAMQSEDRWLVGPEFLKGNPDTWPKQKLWDKAEQIEISEITSRETRREIIGVSFVREPENCVVPITIAILGWGRIVVTMQLVKKYFRRWYNRTRERKLNAQRSLRKRKGRDTRVFESTLPENGGNQSPTERTIDAEKSWYRFIQEACFSRELEALRKGEKLPKGSKLIDIEPHIDDEGLIRAKGRVSKYMSLWFRGWPIILDASHYATKLLIAAFHRRYAHGNNETVINELRQRFYIVGLRGRLRWLAKTCIVCRLRRGKPQNPPMADLPACRAASHQRPFTHCGVDYFGPMKVRIGRATHKRWGVLFTCMTTRAIHVELAHTLNASSAIMAIQRLAARRGFPQEMYSDNGTNFVKAEKELKALIKGFDKEKQENFAIANRFNWHFNPPDAPHMGGAWERLIRSVKTALYHALNDQAPSEEVLSTLLAEIEHMVNSRPLTHVSVDPKDEEALTPNHFLIGSSSGRLNFEKYQSQNFDPRKSFEIAQSMANGFWNRWLREYLPTLLPRNKWHEPTPALKIGDVVLIIDFQAPRNMWKTARVVEVYPNKTDNVTRVVKVRAGKKEFTRPVHKLVRIFSDLNEV